MTPKDVPPANPNFWLPAPENRPDGFEALAFHRGKWTHVCWSATLGGWSLGYGMPYITEGERPFAPLPDKPEGADGFFDWKE